MWDWAGMAPRMRPMSPVRAHSLWLGLCPEKLVKQEMNKKRYARTNQVVVLPFSFAVVVPTKAPYLHL